MCKRLKNPDKIGTHLSIMEHHCGMMNQAAGTRQEGIKINISGKNETSYNNSFLNLKIFSTKRQINLTEILHNGCFSIK